MRISRSELELGLNGVDLIGGHGSQDVKEGIDRQTVPGQIERRKFLDIAEDVLSHITGVEQNPVRHGNRQGFYVLTNAGIEGQATA